MEERECPRSFRVASGEEGRHPASLLRSKNHRRRRTDRIQDRSQILHPGLECRELTAVVRQPGAALVEHDQPKGPSETLIEIAPRRILPPIDQVRPKFGHEHKVDIPIADDLIRNSDATTPRVPDIRPHDIRRHDGIVPETKARSNDVQARARGKTADATDAYARLARAPLITALVIRFETSFRPESIFSQVLRECSAAFSSLLLSWLSETCVVPSLSSSSYTSV